MKKFFLFLFLSSCLVGCSTIQLPNYIKDVHPYKKKFFASYDETVKEVKATLKDFGWTTAGEIDPGIYENANFVDADHRQILIYTEPRKTPLFLYSRFTRLNVIIRYIALNETEVELRCMTVNSVLFKNLTSYKKNRAMQRLLKTMEEKL